jgi:hypothetical protein
MSLKRISLVAITSVLLATASFSPVAADALSWDPVGSEIVGATTSENFGTQVALNDDGTIMAAGAPKYGTSPNQDTGQVTVYRLVNSAWIVMGSPLTGEAGGDYFGQSVSLSSDGLLLAVGAPQNDGAAGAANAAGSTRVFAWNGTAWVQRGVDIDGEAAENQSGTSVSLSDDGSRVAIGAPFNAGAGADSGQLRVYGWNGSAWTPLGADIDGVAGDRLGRAVALSGDGNTVAGGARDNTSSTGVVRVYSFDGTSWSTKGSAIAGEAASDYSGWSVSLDEAGSTVAIGSPYNDGGGSNAGSVRVYAYSGSTWGKNGQDLDGDVAGDLFGWSVSLSADGNTVAAGAPKNPGSFATAGHVRVLEYQTASWEPKGATLTGDAAGDQSGYSVSLSGSGSHIAIGAPFHDTAVSDEGQVRVFSYPTPVVATTTSNNRLHGIYLHVAGPIGRSVVDSPIYFGSYKVMANSRYLVSVKQAGTPGTPSITLAEGQVNATGTFDARGLFRSLTPGNYTITFTGVHQTGTGLRLSAPFSVGKNGEFVALGSNLPGIW